MRTPYAKASDISRDLGLGLSNREVEALASHLSRNPQDEEAIPALGKKAALEYLFQQDVLQRKSRPTGDT
jgi:hypothetical protein